MPRVSDTFDRADSNNLGGNYSSDFDGSLRVVANKAAAQTAPGGSKTYGSYWTADIFPDDQFSEAPIPAAPSSGSWVGVTVRATNGNGYLFLAWSHGGSMDEWNAYRFDGHSFTQIGNFFPSSPGPGDVIRIEAEGSTIRFLRNGVVLGSVTDSNHPSGSPGVMAFTAVGGGETGTLDDWNGGDLHLDLDAEATLALTTAIAAAGARDAVASATLGFSPALAASAVVVSTSVPVMEYDVDGYPSPEERARQDALGRELLGEWAPLLTGTKRWDRQAARARRGFGPEPPIQSEPGAHV